MVEMNYTLHGSNLLLCKMKTFTKFLISGLGVPAAFYVGRWDLLEKGSNSSRVGSFGLHVITNKTF